MSRVRDHLLYSLAAALLLAALQLVIENQVLAYVFRGQIVAPYDFFTTQVYDFFAKIRYFCDSLLFWSPGLPDAFLSTDSRVHRTLLTALLPAVFTTAFAGATALGLLGALIAGRYKPNLRAYVCVWAVIGIIVHLAAAIPPLSLHDDPSLHHILYRSRSFLIDGTAPALLVMVLAFTAAFFFAPVLEQSALLRRASLAGLALSITVAFYSGLGSSTAPALAPFDLDTAAAGPVGRYNVLLISLDSLRADHVGCYGYQRDTSPSIDKLASEGVRFANAVATSSWTLPTHLTMVTSRYQTAHGVVHDTNVLSSATPTLAEILKANGYTTAGFVSAPYVAGHYGHARGMDSFVDLSAAYEHRREARSAVVAPEITKKAVEWLEDNRDERFFLFLHYFDIHYDYVPPAPFDRLFDPDYSGSIDGTDFIERDDVNPDMDPRDLAHILALYDGEIRFTDSHVGMVLRKLEELGLDGNTLVVLVADHGEEFFEHGNKGHHRSLYREVLDIPFIVRFPERRYAGRVVDEQASLVDIMPTILDVTGVEGPTDMEGLSLLDFLGDTKRVLRGAVYGELYDKRGFNVQVARRTPSSTAIQHFNRILHPRRSPWEYYDRSVDRDEQRDIHEERSAELTEQLDLMARWLQQRWMVHREFQARSQGSEHIELDAETVERLKSLGYTGD